MDARRGLPAAEQGPRLVGERRAGARRSAERPTRSKRGEVTGTKWRAAPSRASSRAAGYLAPASVTSAK